MDRFAPRPLFFKEIAPLYPLKGGCVGFRAGLDSLEKGKTSFACRDSIHDFSYVSSLGLVTITNTLSRLDHLILM
jgi:hypothetical protein